MLSECLFIKGKQTSVLEVIWRWCYWLFLLTVYYESIKCPKHLKEFHREHSYNHRLESAVNIFPHLPHHILMHLLISPSINWSYFLNVFPSKSQTPVFFSLFPAGHCIGGLLRFLHTLIHVAGFLVAAISGKSPWSSLWTTLICKKRRQNISFRISGLWVWKWTKIQVC